VASSGQHLLFMRSNHAKKQGERRTIVASSGRGMVCAMMTQLFCSWTESKVARRYLPFPEFPLIIGVLKPNITSSGGGSIGGVADMIDETYNWPRICIIPWYFPIYLDY